MKTLPPLLIQQVHLRTEEQCRLFAVSQALLRRLNPGCHLLVIDNASPLDPLPWMAGEWEEHRLGPMSDDVPVIAGELKLLRFAEAIGHFNYGGTADGPGRANMRSIQVAHAGGYKRAVYFESDCLVSLPVKWWFDRMKKPVACQPVCRHGFVDWQVMPYDVQFMASFGFVEKYDWKNQTVEKNAGTFGEQQYFDILGDDVEIIPVRGERVEGTLDVKAWVEKYKAGVDFVTHGDYEIYAAFLVLNGHKDLVPMLGERPQDWNAIGVALANAGHFVSAEVAFSRAVADEPQRPDLLANHANVLRRLWRFEEAASRISKSLKIDPEGHIPMFIAGSLALDAGQPLEALKWFDAAGVTGEQAAVHERFCRSVALLSVGRWKEGFSEFESRMSSTNQSTLPLWDGSPGKVVAIHHEQGFGDTILAARFLQKIPKGLFRRVYFGVPAQLVRLFQGQDIGPCGLLSMNEDMPPVDCVLPLMSLPERLGIGDVFSAPYLVAPQKYSIRKPGGTRLAVGLVWRSKAQGVGLHFEHALHGDQKSMPFESLLPLASIPGVALYSLQTGDAMADIDRHGAATFVENLGGKILDFADMAGFMAGLDLIVSVDTAPAHLAGALGRPVIVALNAPSAWQWGVEAQSKWYPGATVRRQKTPGDWPSVVRQIADDIRAIVLPAELQEAADD